MIMNSLRSRNTLVFLTVPRVLWRLISESIQIQLKDKIKKASPENRAADEAELQEWKNELKAYQALIPVESEKNQLKLVDLPELETKIKDLEPKITEHSEAAEEVCFPLSLINRVSEKLMH